MIRSTVPFAALTLLLLAGCADGGDGSEGGSTGVQVPPPSEPCANPVTCVVEDVVDVLEDPPVLP